MLKSSCFIFNKIFFAMLSNMMNCDLRLEAFLQPNMHDGIYPFTTHANYWNTDVWTPSAVHSLT